VLQGVDPEGPWRSRGGADVVRARDDSTARVDTCRSVDSRALPSFAPHGVYDIEYYSTALLAFFTIASQAGEVASKPPTDPHGISPLYRHLYHLQHYDTAEMKMEKLFFFCFSRGVSETPEMPLDAGFIFSSSPSLLLAVAVAGEDMPC